MTSQETTTGTSPATTPATTAQRTADTARGKVFNPSANPGAMIVGVFLGLALIGLAAVTMRDLLIHVGWIGSDEWLAAAAQWIQNLSWSAWMWPAAVVSVVVGLWLLVLAVRPRRRTHIGVADFDVVWTRPGDVARRVSAAVSSLPGVEHATTVVGRRKVKVAVITDSDDVDLASVEHAVDGVLSGIDRPLRAKISLKRRLQIAKGDPR